MRLEKSKNLHSQIMYVCSVEEKVSTNSEKVDIQLLCKGTHLSHMS